MERSRTALILGGGGMFGAYQAGVWQVLADHFQPDYFVGASIGSLNAWAMAGGCPPAVWVEQWLNMDPEAMPPLRFPRSLVSGCVDAAAFERSVRRVYDAFTPRTPAAVALTDVVRRRPWLVRSPEIGWQHLAASCAFFPVFPQYRINDRWQTDGGILQSVPLWCAAELELTRVVTVNLLPAGGPWWLRATKRCLNAVAPRRPAVPDDVDVVAIEHPGGLGPAVDSVRWSPSSAKRLIELGRADATAALPRLKHFDSPLF